MSYRDGAFDDGGDETPVRDEAEVARKTWGGWLFVALLLLGGLLALAGYSPVSKDMTYSDLFPAVGIFVEAAIAAVLAWRVREGKGWIAGSVLLAGWAVELIGKLVGGTLNGGWAIFHLAGMANLFLGVRACWRLRWLAKESE